MQNQNPEEVLKLYRHETPIQIRFGDFDMLAHVNNARYLSYMEASRIQYFEDVIGEGAEIDWQKEGIILASATVNFIKPILIQHRIVVKTRISRFGTKSFDLEYLFVHTENGKEVIMATGKTVMVSFNFQTNQTIPVPPSWLKKAGDYEPGLT